MVHQYSMGHIAPEVHLKVQTRLKNKRHIKHILVEM